MNRALYIRVVLTALAFSVGLENPAGQGLPTATPESVGFSTERLGRVTAAMQEAVEEGHLAGVVTLIARRGQVIHFEANGWQDREQKIPMRTDTIFRIASLTKTATSVAAMMLMEEGKLLVGDPVSKYIPSFANTTVAVPPPDDAPDGTAFTVVPAKEPIRVHHLLTKTAGMGYPPAYLRPTYAPLELNFFYFSDKAEPMRTIVAKIAALPFTSHPGERYENGFATDVLGVVIEEASGMSLDRFFETRIFEPLGMSDTSFFLPPEKGNRLAVVYTAQRDGTVGRADGEYSAGQGHYVEGPRVAFGGGGGLLSTATDFARLVQMLVNGGELNGVRLLGPKTVQLMFSNHVGDMYRHPGFGTLGFGYGAELTLDLGTAHHLGSPGDFGYRSAYFSRYWGDPAEQLVALFFAQLSSYGGTSDLHYKYRSLVYQALIDPAAGRSKK